jgi:O-antigen/teichoic acid export membrane protein
VSGGTVGRDPGPETGERPSPTARGGLRRVLARQLVWVVLGRITAAALQAALFVLAARALAVDDFGHLMAFVGVVTLAQVVIDCGVQTFIARERAARPDSGAVATALNFTKLSSGVMVALLAAGLCVAAIWIDGSYWQMLPLAVWAAGERNADMRLAVTFSDGHISPSLLNLVGRRAFSIVAFATALALGVAAILAFSAACAVAALGSAVSANVLVRRRVTAKPSIGYRELLRASVHYWVTNIAGQARNLDVVLVSAFAGAGQAGLYSSGSRLVNPLQILPSSLAAVLLPASARTARSRAVLARLLLLAGAVVAGLTVVYAAIFAATPQVIDLALGERYAGATDVIRIILVGLPFGSAAAMLQALLLGRDQGRAVAVSSTVATVACLLGVVTIAPSGGANGAAAALSASFALQALLLAATVVRIWREPASPDDAGDDAVHDRSAEAQHEPRLPTGPPTDG